MDNLSKIPEFPDFSDIFKKLSTLTSGFVGCERRFPHFFLLMWRTRVFRMIFLRKIFLSSLFCTKIQKSFGLLSCFMAFGCSMESPSISHLNSCLVRSLASDALRGHWNLPAPSSLFERSTKPSRSKYKALILLQFLPQKRYIAFE